MPQDVGQVFREARPHPVAYLAGANNWEASLIRPFDLPMPAILGSVPASRAREVYGALGDLELKETYFGDVLFLAPAWTLAAGMRAASTPAWLYYYTYVDENERGMVRGAAHGAEVSHLFRRALRSDKALTAADLKVSEPLRRYWLRFARSADPNVSGLPPWPPFTPERPAVMEFGADRSCNTIYSRTAWTFIAR